MSQLLAETLKGVQWAEQKALRNGTAFPRLGPPKLWWVPAANASRPERLPELHLPELHLPEPHWPELHLPEPHWPEPRWPEPRWPEPRWPEPRWPAHARPHEDARLHVRRRGLPARPAEPARRLLQDTDWTQDYLKNAWKNCSTASFFEHNEHGCWELAGLIPFPARPARRLLQDTDWTQDFAGAKSLAACAQLTDLALALSAAAIAICLVTIILLVVVWRRVRESPKTDKPCKPEGGPLYAPCPPRSDTI